MASPTSAFALLTWYVVWQATSGLAQLQVTPPYDIRHATTHQGPPADRDVSLTVTANEQSTRIAIAEGEFAAFRCGVAPGSPRPDGTFSWRHPAQDNTPGYASRLYDLAADHSGVLLLDAVATDSGTYTCSLVLSTGQSVTGSVYLEVLTADVPSPPATRVTQTTAIPTNSVARTSPGDEPKRNALHFGVVPHSVTARQNSTATLHCEHSLPAGVVLVEEKFSRVDSGAVDVHDFRLGASPEVGPEAQYSGGQFVLKQLQSTDSGLYGCTLATSNGVTLKVAALVLVGDFTNVAATVDLGLTGSEKALAAYYSVEYRIQSGYPYGAWFATTFNTRWSAAMATVDVSMPDTVSYRVRINITDAKGGIIKAVEKAITAQRPVTTAEPRTEPPTSAPVVSVKASSSLVELGDSVSFRCLVAYTGGQYVIAWSRQSGAPLPPGRHSVGGRHRRRLRLYRARIDDADDYVCTVQTASGSSVSASARLAIDSSNLPPQPTPAPPLFKIRVSLGRSQESRRPGGFVRLHCRYEHSLLARGLIRVRWLHDRRPVTAGQRVRLSNGNRTLLISGLVVDDAGDWECVVSAVIAEGRASARLKIAHGTGNHPPPLITSSGGFFKEQFFSARWSVDDSSSTVSMSLWTSLPDQWLGFGVSHNQNMANSDIIMGYAHGSGSVVVEDRWAILHALPIMDPKQDVTDIAGHVNSSGTTLAFALPCWSNDAYDISLSGHHYFMFARGHLAQDPVRMQQHTAYSRWVLPDLVPIRCATRPVSVDGGAGKPTVQPVVLKDDTATVSATSTSRPPGACSVGGITRAVGAVWQANLCTSCTCTGTAGATHLNCSAPACPGPARPRCDTPVVLDDQCCPVCQDYGWPEPREDYHLSSPTHIALHLPEPRTRPGSDQRSKVYVVRYRRLSENGKDARWIQWPERVADGHSNVLVTSLRPGTAYEIVLCAEEGTLAITCSMPYSTTTGVEGAAQWAAQPYATVDSTYSSLSLRMPHMKNDTVAAGVDRFELAVRYAARRVGGNVVAWSEWQALPALDAGRHFAPATAVTGLAPGKSGIVQFSCRPAKLSGVPPASLPWSLPLQVQLPAVGAPVWPPGAFPIDGVRNDSLLIVFPLELPVGVTYYNIHFRWQGTELIWAPWKAFANDDKDRLSFWLTDLASNTTYQIKLEGVNNTHSGMFGTTATIRTLVSGIPSQPPPPKPLSIGITQLVTIPLPWAFFLARNQTVSCFTVMYRPVFRPGQYGAFWTARGCVGTPQVDLVHARPLSRYEILLIAANEAGSSPPGLSAFTTTPRVFPPFPPNISFAIGHTSTSVSVRIPKLSDPPALHPVSSIAVRYSIAGSNHTHVGPVVPVRERPVSVGLARLRPSTTYAFQFQSLGEGGQSTWSLDQSITTLAIGDAIQPYAPTLLHGQSAETVLVALPLHRAVDALHRALRYEVGYAAQRADGTWPDRNGPHMPTAPSGVAWIVLRNLARGTAYRVHLRAITSRGASAWSPFSAISTPESDYLPGLALPRVVTISSRSVSMDAAALVAWSMSHGQSITATIRIVPTAALHGGARRFFTVTPTINSSYVRLPNLIPNTTYSVWWKLASDSGKTSPWRRGRRYTTRPASPERPDRPVLRAVTVTTSSVEMSLPSSAWATDADRVYVVEMCMLPESADRCRQSTLSKKVQFPDSGVFWTGLVPGEIYQFRLRAENSVGSSPPSQASFLQTVRPGQPLTPPSPTVGFNVSRYSVPLVLVTRHPLFDHVDYVPVAAYRVGVRRPGDDRYTTVAEMAASSDGLLLNGVYAYDEGGRPLHGQYRFKLQAVSKRGAFSAWSEELVAEPLREGLPVVPGAPSVRRAAAGSKLVVRSAHFSRQIPGHPIDYFNVSVIRVLARAPPSMASDTPAEVPAVYFQVPFGTPSADLSVDSGHAYRVCVSAVNMLAASPFGPCSSNGTAPRVLNRRLIETSRRAMAGSRVTLPCPVSGHPMAVRHWTFRSLPVSGYGGNKHVRSDGALDISAASLNDTGEYACVAANAFGNVSLTLRLAVSGASECVRNDRAVPAGEARRFLQSWSGRPAMDVVFLVGQSPSLSRRYDWLARLPGVISERLRNASYSRGSAVPESLDRFSLYSFGTGRPGSVYGDWLPMPTGGVWGTDRELRSAAQLLLRAADGGYQDGWHALRLALQTAELRGTAVCHVVLVTDESRHELQPELSEAQLSTGLHESGCSLHVVADGGGSSALVAGAENSDVLGVTSTGVVYRHSSAGVTALGDQPPHQAQGDYSRLALHSDGGSLWNVQQLLSDDDELAAGHLASALASHVSSVTMEKLCERCMCHVTGSLRCSPCSSGE